MTLKKLKQHIEYVQWIEKYSTDSDVLLQIADKKIKQFAAEAKSLNAAQMSRLKAYKRYALAVALVTIQKATALDDLGTMLIKLVNKIHRNGRKALTEHIEQNQERADQLIDTLHQILYAYQQHKDSADRETAIESIIGDKKEALIKNCEDHALYAGKNYFPFLWRYHASNRVALFDILDSVKLVATTQSNDIIKAIEVVIQNRKSKKVLLCIDEAVVKSCSSWMSERWQKAVFDPADTDGSLPKVHRQYFELCVFYNLMLGLKSGDICIDGSDAFADYRKQLLSWEDYSQMIDQYGLQVGLPVQRNAFIQYTQAWLKDVAERVDDSFPANEHIRIEGGKPVIRKNSTKKERCRLTWRLKLLNV